MIFYFLQINQILAFAFVLLLSFKYTSNFKYLILIVVSFSISCLTICKFFIGKCFFRNKWNCKKYKILQRFTKEDKLIIYLILKKKCDIRIKYFLTWNWNLFRSGSTFGAISTKVYQPMACSLVVSISLALWITFVSVCLPLLLFSTGLTCSWRPIEWRRKYWAFLRSGCQIHLHLFCLSTDFEYLWKSISRHIKTQVCKTL